MKIFKIVLLGLLMTGVYAQSPKWEKLEPIGYSIDNRSFNFEKNVRVMKITWKEKGYDNQVNIVKVSLDSFDKSIVKQFINIKAKYSSKANIKYKGNAFFIDSKGKIWQMDMIEDVISLMGDIDTPSEAQLVVWLHQGKNAKEYSKTSKGYKLRVETYKNNKCYLDEVFVSKKGTLSPKRLKRGCQKLAKKKYIKNKTIKYERFDDIVIDAKENIYLLGTASDTKSNGVEVVTIDKYNKHGKEIWQRVIHDGYIASAKMLALKGKYLYFINTSNRYDFILQYSIEGKFISSKAFDGEDKNQFEAIYKHSNLNKIKNVPYYRDASGHDIEFREQIRSKNGNIYAVGSEIENIIPEEDIPAGQCGNTDRFIGAFIVKFDKNGDQVWAKVIDIK